ncbi:hypothetical protein GLOIN_2v1580086 [Rhizophagus clarus]|uniref:Uncharacterized protein n=1 Tax=Rhizophagus clarus TaxID=94130 RepID=A0A8H3R5K6_9GLOM|nr:hypothetical protein GLOIN_2v1580086 [Rhizophagus clarus]
MSDRSLPQRFFRLPLPKPINDAILCQQTLNLYLIGKLMPNRRGRKPLATMPLGKSSTHYNKVFRTSQFSHHQKNKLFIFRKSRI